MNFWILHCVHYSTTTTYYFLLLSLELELFYHSIFYLLHCMHTHTLPSTVVLYFYMIMLRHALCHVHTAPVLRPSSSFLCSSEQCTEGVDCVGAAAAAFAGFTEAGHCDHEICHGMGFAAV